jgi:glycosyltransferase involved in cell wall biosynthesis
MWDKGVGEFVEAARLVKSTHPDARFCLAGFVDVDNPSAISRSVVASWESEGLIEYLGSFDDMVPVYSGAACVVLPSYREGMPRSLLEAAAMGKPVITTDVPGCREAVVPGTTGWTRRLPNAMRWAWRREHVLSLSSTKPWSSTPTDP